MNQYISSGHCSHRACRRALTPQERELGNECAVHAIGGAIAVGDFRAARQMARPYGLSRDTVEGLIAHEIRRVARVQFEEFALRQHNQLLADWGVQ